MIKTLVLAILAITHPPLTYTMPDIQIAQAGVQEAVVPEVVPEAEQEENCNNKEVYFSNEEVYYDNNDYYAEPQEELPTPADEYEYTQDAWTPLGVYHITHYSAEACGNAIGARERPGGLVEGESIAMPEWWMLGHTVFVEGYGFYTVDDISPGGIADIFHWRTADAVGSDYQMVWLVG